MAIDDHVDETMQSWTEGYDEGYGEALKAVTAEYQRMFNMDETQQARFRWVLTKVKEEAGLTL